MNDGYYPYYSRHSRQQSLLYRPSKPFPLKAISAVPSGWKPFNILFISHTLQNLAVCSRRKESVTLYIGLKRLLSCIVIYKQPRASSRAILSASWTFFSFPRGRFPALLRWSAGQTLGSIQSEVAQRSEICVLSSTYNVRVRIVHHPAQPEKGGFALSIASNNAAPSMCLSSVYRPPSSAAGRPRLSSCVCRRCYTAALCIPLVPRLRKKLFCLGRVVGITLRSGL